MQKKLSVLSYNLAKLFSVMTNLLLEANYTTILMFDHFAQIRK